MFRAVTGERALLRARRQFNVTDRFSLGHRRRWPGLLPVICFVLSAMIFHETANAAEVRDENGSFSALHDYVQLISASGKSVSRPNPNSGNVEPNESSNGAYGALRAFADRIGVDEPAPSAELPKLVEAPTLLKFLRGLNSPAQSSAPPKGSRNDNGPVAGGTKPSAPLDAHFVGAKVCLTCHANQAESFSRTLMGKIGKTQQGKFDCENCHGPGSAHVKAGGGRGVGGIISFRPDDLSRTAQENNDICLGCHLKGTRTNWFGSTHDERGLMCSNCHTVMKNVSRKFQLKTAFQPDTCFQCHKNKRAEMWRSSHIPVREGKVTCTDCHNPHGSYSENLLKTATVNEVCWQCHAEKRGPFLWEHPPVTESCLNCHDPHGSNNDFLLKISRPRLCQQCHSGGQHNSNPRNPAVTLYAQGRECQNCHSNHHGSNNPAGPRFMR